MRRNDQEWTIACASRREMRLALELEKLGYGTARLVGMRCHFGIPPGQNISFLYAGGLQEANELPVGTTVTAYRVVDIHGNTLWEGEPIGFPGARQAIIVGSQEIIDIPDERRRLRDKIRGIKESDALLIDNESHIFAQAKSLGGCIRMVTDTPTQPLGLLAGGLKQNGRVALSKVFYAFLKAPRESRRAARNTLSAERMFKNALQ